MSKLKDYPYDDQIFYIENFIRECNKLCSKVPKNNKETVSAESYLLNQLIKPN